MRTRRYQAWNYEVEILDRYTIRITLNDCLPADKEGKPDFDRERERVEITACLRAPQDLLAKARELFASEADRWHELAEGGK